MNDILQPEENRLTSRELDILYMLKEFNSTEINKASKDHLMDKLNFSSKTQIGAYISVLFRKGSIFKSPTQAWVYHFNQYFFPSGNDVPSEIVIKVIDGEA